MDRFRPLDRPKGWRGRSMPEQSVIVWDLETVPDLAAAARMLDKGSATQAEVRESIGPGFPKHPLHKIACIGTLIASRQPEGWRMGALGAPHVGERTEDKLISDFVEKIGQLRPQLVTFNGHSFDLPVLRYRAMVDRLAAVGLQVRPYFYRYSEDALDLCDVLGSYVPGAKVRLDEVSKILGLLSPREWTAVASRRWFSLNRSRRSPAIARATC
jgi:predicted PolB exonuclease-like 3'-5' exonuclease